MASVDVSVCVVSCNCRELLRASLCTLADAAPGRELEVIVADNASNDGTREMVTEGFPTVMFLAQPRNVGFATAMNRAVAESSGRLIAWLNPDCEVEAGALGRLADELDERADVDVVAPRLVYPDGRIQLSCGTLPRLRDAVWDNLGLSALFPRSRVFNGHRLGHWSYDETRDVAWASGACLMMRRDAWERVGALDEQFFMYCEELDWFVRLHEQGGRVLFVPDATVKHRHAAITSRDPRQAALWGHQSKFRLFRKHHGRAAECALRFLTLVGSAARLTLASTAWLMGIRARRRHAERAALLAAVCRCCVSCA
ncbi:MAG: glycosyltransferase family 2 protein [Armatimonadota bacterium]